MIVVRSRVGQYREELILNVIVFVLTIWWMALEGGSDIEFYCVSCEDLLGGSIQTE